MSQPPENAAPPKDPISKPTFLLMCGRTAGFAATFFIPVVLVRIFTPEEFGTYKQVFLIYTTVYWIAQLGMAESLFYFLPRDPRNAGRYVLNSVLFLFGMGLACLGLLIATEGRILALLSNSSLGAFMPELVGVFILLMMVSSVLEIVLISRKRYGAAACVYASELLKTVFFLVPVLLWREVRWLLVGAIFFAVLRLCAALFYFAQEFRAALRPDLRLLREQLVYALPFALAVLLATGETNFHQYAVSHYFDAATFAIYSVGCLQIPLMEFIASPAANVMMVLMSEKIREGDRLAVVSLWHETTRKLALVCFPFVGLLLVTARELIAFLFTETYLASVPIFIIWSATIVFSALQTDALFRVFAATRFLLFLNFIRLSVIVGLTSLFIARFGLIGAVLVTILALVVGKGLSLVKIKQLLGVPVSRLLPWKALAAIAAIAALAGAGPAAIQAVVEFPAFPLLAISGLTYAVLYLALLLRFGLLNDTEQSILAGWLRLLKVPLLRAWEIKKLEDVDSVRHRRNFELEG